MEVTIENIMSILEDIRSDIDFANEKKLIDDKLLDSFDIISIVGEFNDAFEVDINVMDLKNENFNSVEAMKDLIIKLQNEE